MPPLEMVDPQAGLVLETRQTYPGLPYDIDNDGMILRVVRLLLSFLGAKIDRGVVQESF